MEDEASVGDGEAADNVDDEDEEFDEEDEVVTRGAKKPPAAPPVTSQHQSVTSAQHPPAHVGADTQVQVGEKEFCFSGLNLLHQKFDML